MTGLAAGGDDEDDQEDERGDSVHVDPGAEMEVKRDGRLAARPVVGVYFLAEAMATFGQVLSIQV